MEVWKKWVLKKLKAGRGKLEKLQIDSSTTEGRNATLTAHSVKTNISFKMPHNILQWASIHG